MAEEIPVLVCLRVSEDTMFSVLPGAAQGTCSQCEHRVWISRSGQTMVAAREVDVRCIECGMTDVAPDTKMSVVEGAFDEIRALKEDLGGSF